MSAVRTGASAVIALISLASAAGAAQVNVIYAFKGAPDGGGPNGALATLNGALWGTTYLGGDVTSCSPWGCGTVFTVGTNGQEKVVHQFVATRDGLEAYGGLLSFDGNLYGTTSNGGPNGKGTVFRISADGQFRVLHAFGRPGDGALPYGTLVAAHGMLYGTTAAGGGPAELGTVFQITPGGSETVLYAFRPNGTDANGPIAGLTNVGGELYGTAEAGGVYGWGAVFKVSSAGAENLVYSFTSVSDGYAPLGGLVYSGGSLYGTTEAGGLCGIGCGTAFSIDPRTGAKTTLHEFTGGIGGALPQTNLFSVGTAIFSLTEIGGANTCAREANGCGALIKFFPSGAWRLSYSFGGTKPNGFMPTSGLTSLAGGQYGVTYYGGQRGFGTVYSLVLP